MAGLHGGIAGTDVDGAPSADCNKSNERRGTISRVAIRSSPCLLSFRSSERDAELGWPRISFGSARPGDPKTILPFSFRNNGPRLRKTTKACRASYYSFAFTLILIVENHTTSPPIASKPYQAALSIIPTTFSPSRLSLPSPLALP